MAEEDIHILPIVFLHTLTPLVDQVCALEKEPISDFLSPLGILALSLE